MHCAGAWAVHNRDHLSDAAREALEHVMVCVDEPGMTTWSAKLMAVSAQRRPQHTERVLKVGAC